MDLCFSSRDRTIFFAFFPLDIVERLSIPKAKVLVSSFNRPNIKYLVQPKKNSYARLMRFLSERRNESGIVYCLSRASAESIAENLRAEGYAALPYHAGLDKRTRDENQTKFLNDEVRIIVATIAFGMGIDKSNVRFVVHMDLPKNIESYYQETGRAGRDGLPSVALLFYTIADVIKLKGFVEVEGNQEQTEIMLRKLDQMGEFGELKTCRRRYLLKYFDEVLNEDCGNCDNCQTEFEKFDGTILAQKALSAVARTGQRYGLSYIVEFLRGSKSARIRDDHKELKTYGVGAELSKDDWDTYIKQMIAQGILAQSAGSYPIITLSDESNAVLKGEVKVELIKPHTVSHEMDETEAPPHDAELFELLRAERAAIAREEGLPPYIIFSDATLIDMATYFPQTREEMLDMSGVGDVKLASYGSRFLSVLVDYCGRNRKESKRKSRFGSTKRRKNGATGETSKISFQMYRSGMPVNEIAASRGLAISTVEGHLAKFIESGELDLHEVVEPRKAEVIRSVLLEMGSSEAVGPVKAKLGNEFSYGEIRAVMADFQRRAHE